MRELAGLPNELLVLIIGHLVPKFVHLDRQPAPRTDLLNARLVSHKWNILTTPHLLHTVTLRDSTPTNMSLDDWNSMLESTAVRPFVRRVIFKSSPIEAEHDGRDEMPAQLPGAVSRIERLPRLEEVYLRFSTMCWGVEHGTERLNQGHGSPWARKNALRAVFEAIRRRANRPGFSTIHSLRLEFLQNMPLPDFTTSDLFKSVVKDVTKLHLCILTEENEDKPTDDLYYIERLQFEPYMHKSWLVPLSSNLTELTLYFDDFWGVPPGTFDGRGLEFPNLKTLQLGRYTIAHHEQFDWVLRQTSIKNLYLDWCLIISYISCDTAQLNGRAIERSDWKALPQGSFGFVQGEGIFHFPGTWASIFDRIRARLSNLVEFGFHIQDPDLSGFYDATYLRRDQGYSGTHFHEISHERYVNFQENGYYETPWILGTSDDGEMRFGYNDPRDIDESSGKSRSTIKYGLNRSKETKEIDQQALNELMKATWARR